MRSYFTLSLVFIISVSCSHKNAPVESDTQMMDQANKIILAVNEDPIINYNNIVQYLSDNGFRIHIRDASSLEVQTAYKPIGTGGGNNSFIRINASVIDSTIHFYGKISGKKLEERELRKMGGSDVYQQAWQQLVEIAEGYPHEEIYFSRN